MKKKTFLPPPPPPPAPEKVPPKKRVPTKKAAAKAAPEAKPAAKSKPAGGAVAQTVTTAKDGARSTIPPGATVLLADAEYSSGVIDALKTEFPPDTIAKEFKSLMKAETENRFGEAQTDFRTRLTALEKLMQYTVGKPLERTQTTVSTTYTYEEIEELIAHSPMLRQSLRKMLRPYDAEDGIGTGRGGVEERGRLGDVEKRRGGGRGIL